MPWVLRGLREGVLTTRYPQRPDGYGPDFRASVTLRRPGASVMAREDVTGVGSLCPTGAIDVAVEPTGQTNGAVEPTGQTNGAVEPTGQTNGAVEPTGQTNGAVEPTGQTNGAGPLDGPGPLDGGAAGRISVDRGRCIACGRCVAARPDLFEFDPSPESARLTRGALVVGGRLDDDEGLARLRGELARRVRALRRSVHIRHVDAGSDGSEEWEVAALLNPVYDVQRLGVFFTASPRHADVLLVTGAGTQGMRQPLQATYEAMPHPKVVLAAGTDAVSGGLVRPSEATSGGVGDLVPVDVFVPGSPPSPFSLLHGILLAIGLLPGGSER